MEESRCPLCGGKLDMTDATDWGRSVRGDALARIACVGCGLSLTAPAEAFDGAWRALSGRGDRMTVQSIQRANPTGEVGEDGQPVVQQQAIVTTDGIVMEALVNLDKVAERWPGRSPLGLLEDALLLAVAKRPYPHAVKTRRWKAMAALPATARSTSERRWRTRVKAGSPSAVGRERPPLFVKEKVKTKV